MKIYKLACDKPKTEIIVDALEEYMEGVGDSWNYILPTELADKGPDKFFVLDTRRPEDFEKGHIKGAANIFWLDLLKSENLEKLPEDEKIVVVCYVGHTASQIMMALRLLGYDAVALKFGMGVSPSEGVPVAGWTDYGFEIVSGK